MNNTIKAEGNWRLRVDSSNVRLNTAVFQRNTHVLALVYRCAVPFLYPINIKVKVKHHLVIKKTHVFMVIKNTHVFGPLLSWVKRTYWGLLIFSWSPFLSYFSTGLQKGKNVAFVCLFVLSLKKKKSQYNGRDTYLN